MRKHVDLGISLARKWQVPIPTAAAADDIMRTSKGHENREIVDFCIVLEYMAKCSGATPESDNVDVPSGRESD